MVCIKEYSGAAIFFHLSAPDPVPLKYIFKEYTNIIPRIYKYLSTTGLHRLLL